MPSEEGTKSPSVTSLPQPVWSGVGSDPSQGTPGRDLAVALPPQPRAVRPLRKSEVLVSVPLSTRPVIHSGIVT